ncbi:MAG: SDR family oxidoreductase [Balneolaceae bacterium]|nr:SDR family oxidoreductase [Balneolaceae bacterium]
MPESGNILSKFILDGKTAIVTGASRGLGKAMATGLAEAGADLVLVARDEAALRDTAGQVHEVGSRALVTPCDVTNTDRFKRKVIDKAIDQLGHIDILVNNAGIIRRAPAAEHPDSYWDEVIDVNLTSVFRISREVGKIMLEQDRGKIINIASVLSYFGGITVPSYAASKGGIAQLTKALANEWAGHNIQVNAVAPGYFETDNTKPLLEDEERRQAITGRIPFGRWGKPEDLKGTVVFLASEASEYVNGHVLVVDGGWMAR